MFLPRLAVIRHYNYGSIKGNHFKQIGLALEMYTNNNNGYLPTVGHPLGLQDYLYPRYLDAVEVFLCPARRKTTKSDDPEKCGYWFNVRVSGRELSSLPEGTIIMYEPPWTDEEHQTMFVYLVFAYRTLIPISLEERVWPLTEIE